MGKVVERKKNKKKGRPSLLDLQKRSLKEQQQQQQQQLLLRQKHNHKPNNNKTPNPSSALPPPNNYKSAVSTALRRSTRHNPVLHDDRDEEERGEEEQEEDDDDDDEEEDVRREKKLKLVLKLPHNENSGSDGFDSNGDDHSNAPSNRRKRKIDAIADGSGLKEGNSADGATDVQEPGPSTPLPDKKLLLFILDRLQKKDTYGVFSEPVDPEELPDYHEVVEHPMDFGTIRKQLSAGSYMNLEQFEKDVFLICSNAMQYNAPDTIYFRQARSIQELAKKDFENLRQDSDDNEPEPKVVRRGRPPTKNLKKALQRLQLDRAASEFSSDATLATGPERTNTSSNDLRKGPHLSEKSGLADSSGRFNGSRNDSYLLTDSKFERNDDAAVSIFKGVKHGKRPSVLDENRRNTYRQFHALAVTREASVWTTFDAERKQLMAVGLMSEHGYARSVARFAANIGSVAWKIASKRIERSLPPGVEFGPGWVADNDIPPPRPLFPSSTSSARLSPLWPLSLAKNQSDATPPTNGSKEEMMPEKLEDDHCSGKQVASIYSATGVHSSSSLSSSSTSLIGAIKSEHETERCNAVEGMVSHAGFNILKSSVGAIRPRPPLQMHQSPVIRPGMNGFNGTYGISHPTHVGKVIGTRPASYNFRSPQMVDAASRMDTNVAQSSGSHVAPENASATNSCGEWLNSGSEANEAPTSGLQPHSSRQGILRQSTLEQRGLSPRPKPDPIPPDLNVRFQGPGSPSSSRADPAQPDLALQL